MDNRQGVVSLNSSRLLSILDEASERTFLSNELKGDASKDVLEDKNLVASLSIIFEQSLVSSYFHSQWSSPLLDLVSCHCSRYGDCTSPLLLHWALGFEHAKFQEIYNIKGEPYYVQFFYDR